MSVHSATLSPDEADVWSVLVSSLSARDDGLDGDQGDDLGLDTTVVDLVDHFAVIDDPLHHSWVVHPLAAVLVLCAAAVVAGMRGVHRDRRVSRRHSAADAGHGLHAVR